MQQKSLSRHYLEVFYFVGNIILFSGLLVGRSNADLRLWRQMGCVVWLQAEAETVFRRMRRKKNRLFLPKQASVETVQQMMAEREPLYAETAGFSTPDRRKPVEAEF